MRGLWTLLLVSGMAFGQAAGSAKPEASAPGGSDQAAQPAAVAAPQANATVAAAASAQTEHPAAPANPNAVVIPAGARIPLTLAQAISTKNAREGDAVYAQTAFPFVQNDHVLIPAGTYIQGKIMHSEHAGRSKKRAEILIHFTSMIYPSGYTVMLPGSIENTPGADDKSVKDSEGTIQQDKDTGKRVEDAAKGG